MEESTPKKSKTKHQRAMRDRRIAAGLCVDCGKVPPTEGTRKCEPCHETYRELARNSWKRRYDARRAAGLCGMCGEEPEPGKFACRGCRERNRRHGKVRDTRVRAERKATGLCVECGGERDRPQVQKCDRCSELARVRVRSYLQRDKDAAFTAYGGYRCSCPGCDVTTPAFLHIDHVNNDGAKHRREDPTAFKIYSWLKRHGYPDGFQVLCANCNWAKGRYGRCPHQDRDVEDDQQPA